VVWARMGRGGVIKQNLKVLCTISLMQYACNVKKFRNLYTFPLLGKGGGEGCSAPPQESCLYHIVQ